MTDSPTEGFMNDTNTGLYRVNLRQDYGSDPLVVCVTMSVEITGDGSLASMPKYKSLRERVAERIAEGGDDVAEDVVQMCEDQRDPWNDCL